MAVVEFRNELVTDQLHGAYQNDPPYSSVRETSRVILLWPFDNQIRVPTCIMLIACWDGCAYPFMANVLSVQNMHMTLQHLL